MRILSLLLLAAACLPLAAQAPEVPQAPPASAAKESFTIQPGSVERGSRALPIRLVANKAAGFSNSSSKQPALSFSAGVTLVAGSFQLLNQNEAQASINVDDEAAGTIEVKLELFAVNGTKVLTTLRGTLGISGAQSLAGSQASVGAESVKLVQINVTTPQAAGALLIKGKVAGTVSIKAPTGTNFSSAPIAKTDKGDINSPQLQQTNTVFTFSIGNSALEEVNVRVENILYNTQFYGLVAQEGDLACEVSGAALSNQVALVVNAFTAKTEIAGSNDTTGAENNNSNNNTGSESSDSTTPTPTGGGGGGIVQPQGRSLDNNRRTNRERNSNSGNSGGGVRPSPQQPSGRPSGSPLQAPQPGGRAGNSGGGVGFGGGGAASPAGGGSAASPMGGTGSMGNEKVNKDETDKKLETAKEEPRKLEITPGLHFCDKDFQPVTALVLDKAIAGEAGGRVWIVLKLKADKQADKVETVTVKLTVNGTTRELALTETGKNTGEFRCGKEGILVIANENPDSNAEEKEAQPPKPRFDR